MGGLRYVCGGACLGRLALSGSQHIKGKCRLESKSQWRHNLSLSCINGTGLYLKSNPINEITAAEVLQHTQRESIAPLALEGLFAHFNIGPKYQYRSFIYQITKTNKDKQPTNINP